MLAAFSVSNLDDAGIGSLRQAILDANSQAGADSISFNLGLFVTPQTIDLGSALPTIVEDLTITGPGQHLLTLDAGNGADNLTGTGDGYRLLDVDDGSPSNLLTVAIQNLTLTGGDIAGVGGAVRSRENLTITDVAIVANSTGLGAAGSLGAPGQNGGIGARGGDGGGIFSSGGTLAVINSTISGNSTGRGGNGGDGGDGSDGTPGQDGGNGGDGGSGGYGGGIFTDGGTLVITGSTISGNSTGAGGLSGLAGDGGEGVMGGFGGAGGDGGYGGNGGGIYSSVGEVTISLSTISGNFTGFGSAGAAGGEPGYGVLGGDGGDGGDGGSGGGLYSVEGQLEISMSTITGNQAGGGGNGGDSGAGGLIGVNGADGNGGGVFSFGNDPVLIDNSIIAANQAAGLAPDLQTGSVTLNIDYSLIGNGEGLQINSSIGNLIGTGVAPINPLLGPLADNGGTTQTHALLPSSPAIDAGDSSVVFNAGEFDQRGTPFVRVEDGDFVAGGILDFGAYEAQTPPTADFDQDQDVDGSDFLRWQRGFGTTSGALLANGNSDDDGDVDASDLAVWQASYGENASAFQAQRFESDSTGQDDAIPSQALLADLAFTTFGEAQSNKRTTEVTQPEFFSVEAAAIPLVGLSEAKAPKTVLSDSVAVAATSVAAADATDDSDGVEFQLRDMLFSTYF